MCFMFWSPFVRLLNPLPQHHLSSRGTTQRLRHCTFELRVFNVRTQPSSPFTFSLLNSGKWSIVLSWRNNCYIGNVNTEWIPKMSVYVEDLPLRDDRCCCFVKPLRLLYLAAPPPDSSKCHSFSLRQLTPPGKVGERNIFLQICRKEGTDTCFKHVFQIYWHFTSDYMSIHCLSE
jgi:hypothetical protein